MKKLSAGRLYLERYGRKNGDKTIIFQTHRNGSKEIVGKIELDGDEIKDAFYLIGRARAEREAGA